MIGSAADRSRTMDADNNQHVSFDSAIKGRKKDQLAINENIPTHMIPIKLSENEHSGAKFTSAMNVRIAQSPHFRDTLWSVADGNQ